MPKWHARSVGVAVDAVLPYWQAIGWRRHELWLPNRLTRMRLPLDDEVPELGARSGLGSKVSHSVVACGLEHDRNRSSVDPERKLICPLRSSRT